MKTRREQSGITLMEMTIVVAIVAMLAVFGLPAIRALVNSLESSGPTEAMIGAALSGARAIALKEQRYAGIRFQYAYEPNSPKGALTAPQYMVFIVHDPEKKPHGTNLDNGFRAVEGIEPIKLPEAVGVMDLRINWGDNVVDSDSEINTLEDVNDTTTFSIIFSPSGKLVIHDVQVRNRDGEYRPVDPSKSADDIFNSPENIAGYNTGMFVQDDYDYLGFYKEPSRNTFIIYERDKFEAAFGKGRAWSDYLKNLASIYINPYTGTIIKQD
jgi:prepilin-type N-terminal cleavage/methylation domain-containing protein